MQNIFDNKDILDAVNAGDGGILGGAPTPPSSIPKKAPINPDFANPKESPKPNNRVESLRPVSLGGNPKPAKPDSLQKQARKANQSKSLKPTKSKFVLISTVSALATITLLIGAIVLGNTSNYSASDTEGGDKIATINPEKRNRSNIGGPIDEAFDDHEESEETEAENSTTAGDTAGNRTSRNSNTSTSNSNNNSSSAATLTVSFDTRGGSPISPISVKSGDTISAPGVPTKSRQVFLTWTLNGSQYNFSNKVTRDITLTAEYRNMSRSELVVDVYQENLRTEYSARSDRVTNLGIPYNVCWLTYTNVDKTFSNARTVNYSMSGAEAAASQSAAREFEKLVEDWSDRNVNINIIYEQIARKIVVPSNVNALTPAIIQSDLSARASRCDTFITVVAFEANEIGYYGTTFAGVNNDYGYSTIALRNLYSLDAYKNALIAIHGIVRQFEAINGDNRIGATIRMPGVTELNANNAPISNAEITRVADTFRNYFRQNVKIGNDYVGMSPYFWGFKKGTFR